MPGRGLLAFCTKRVADLVKTLCNLTIDKSLSLWYNIGTVMGKPTRKGYIKMITLLNIIELKNNDGLTLKEGKMITYKSGYQVATEGVECHTAREAFQAILTYGGNCGVWYSEGIYYIDKSHRVSTKKEALEYLSRLCTICSIPEASSLTTF